jgi:hypothetical protein
VAQQPCRCGVAFPAGARRTCSTSSSSRSTAHRDQVVAVSAPAKHRQAFTRRRVLSRAGSTLDNGRNLSQKANFAKGLWSPPGSRLCRAPRFHPGWAGTHTGFQPFPSPVRHDHDHREVCDDAFSTGFSRTPISMVAMTATRLWIWFSAAEGAGAADARTHG